MQYMTLISNADRGVGYAHGNWEETINAKSPLSAEAPSSTSTPNPPRDSRKPAVKMSIADYKNLKSTGVKPSPRPSAGTPESRPGADTAERSLTHSRNTSAVSVNTPMARVLSFEGGDQRQKVASSALKNDKVQLSNVSKTDSSIPPRPKLAETKDADKARHVSNGISARESLHAKDTNKDPRASKSDSRHILKEPAKHALPPRPQSPPRSHLESRPQKRNFESGDTHPEKRAKLDHTDSRTPPITQKAPTRKPEAADTKPSPSKSQRPTQSTPSHASPVPKKSTPSRTKPLETKGHSSKSSVSEKPLNIPPLLSPLPADLETPPQPHPESFKKSENSKASKISSQNSKAVGSDTIVVRQPHTKKDLPTSSLLSTSPDLSPPFVLPRLLSPDLPEIVEAELLRLQQKAATTSTTLNSVEARHEKARQPGAPGVAQKRPKIGHPPKKNHGESSGSWKKATIVEKEPEKRSLIVKIPIKKADRGRVRDLLKLRAGQWQEFKRLESKRLEAERSARAPPTQESSESEEDVPLATNRATKAPAPTTSKKSLYISGTSSNSHPPERTSPAAKRPKGTESIEVAKTSTSQAPPFRSPALNGPSSVKDFAHLATPKKGDAMKSVAMRRVDSGDANARTPQPTSTSTPASAEKSRARPEKVIDQEQLSRARAEESKFYPLGTNLKRKSQAIVTKKDITADEKKVGVMRGIEGLMAYMLAFFFRDKIEVISGRPMKADSWEQFFNVWSFVDGNTRNYPELRTLLEQLGAVSREQLTKVYTNIPEESRSWESFITCIKHRDSLWAQCKKNEKLLSDLGIQGTLGPWSSVNDAVGFGVATLSYYALAQNIAWEGDSHFSMNFAKPFMKQGTEPKLTTTSKKDLPTGTKADVTDDMAALSG